MRFLAIGAILISALSAHAENLPSTRQVEAQGGLAFFAGPKRIVWFAPFAFSSSLECGRGETDRDRTCNLRIHHALSGEDQGWVSHYASLGAEREVSGLTASNSDIVQKVEERFEKMDRRVPTGSATSLRTLAFSDDAPYGSIRFWMFPGTERALLNAYASSGVGTFISEATLRAERNEDYLEIRNTAPLREVIEKARQGLKLSVLRSMISNAVLVGQPVANNFTVEEAIRIAYRHLLGGWFKRTRAGSYEPGPLALETLDALQGEPLVIIDESYDDRTIRCRAELPIRKDARASVSCEEGGR
jgi:hypothetical protein